MVFSSPVFLFLFFPLAFVLYKLLPQKLKNYFLILVSFVFYAWGEPVYVLLMLFSVFVNYLVARGIGEDTRGARAKGFLLVGVVINIGMLFLFKYANFFVDNLNIVFNTSYTLREIRLPIGISFFTFQAMSYIIDVYRKIATPQKKFSRVLLYISLFPQLIAGPIVMYNDIADQIAARTETIEKTASGLKRFSIGLAKKLIIANTMGLLADDVYALLPEQINLPIAWLGAIAYALQIYFDFSGYSDMAIGLAKIFGFDLKENFRHPYIANSIRHFWRRWHISLSTWFREYLYIPLGGNRKGSARTSLNLLLVFFFTGLWHGAEWTFVIWGFFHGFFLILERVRILRPESWRLRPLSHLYTLIVVISAFVIFRAETIGQAGMMLLKMFTGFEMTFEMQAFLAQALTPSVVLIGILAIIGSTDLPLRLWLRVKSKLCDHVFMYRFIGSAYAAFLLLICVLSLASQTYNPFIYFRF